MLNCLKLLATIAVLGLVGCSLPTGNAYPTTPQSRSSGKSKRLASYSVIYNFPATKNAAIHPEGQLFLGPDGNFYGTADGQISSVGENPDQGSIYEINTQGSTPTVQTLLVLPGSPLLDSSPRTGVIRGPDGALYGTSFNGGGKEFCSIGMGVYCGFIFKLTKSGGTWQLAKYWAFGQSYSDGATPSGPPLLVDGVLYGVATSGGANGCGTAYKINTDLSTGYATLYNFSCTDPDPMGPLVQDSAGNFYGTLEGKAPCSSGSGNCGEVYELKPSGSTYTFSSLYKFKGDGSNDGATPISGVNLVGTDIYGTTADGGDSSCGGYLAPGCGTIFELVPSGVSSAYSETVLHRFSATYLPSGLVPNGSNAFYGTTELGGSEVCTGPPFDKGCGAVFEITSSGTYTELHDFTGYPNDGAVPYNGVPAVDASGNVWGATRFGGSGSCGYSSISTGCGIVYELGSGSLKHHKQRKEQS